MADCASLRAVSLRVAVVGYLPSRCPVLESPTGWGVSLFALLNTLHSGPSSSLLSSELEIPVPISVPIEGLS